MIWTIFCGAAIGATLESLIGSVKLIDASWGDTEKVAVILSPAIEKALKITEISTATDYELSHKVLTIKFSYVDTSSGHIRVKFYKTASDGTFTAVGSYTTQTLGKPYAYVVYDKQMPPDLTKLIAVMRGNVAWDTAIVDWVVSADFTDDLEYLNQSEYKAWVENKEWLGQTLGPVSHEYDLEEMP